MRGWMAALALLAGSQAPLMAADLVPLFNGKTLDGWVVQDVKNPPADLWTVKDGILTAKPGTGWLSTKQEYGDFVLRVEFRVPVGGNSGVFLRVPSDRGDKAPHVAGCEVQILDDNAPQYKDKLKPYQYCGSVYFFAPVKPGLYRGAGEWNQLEIRNEGDEIVVTMNGQPASRVSAAENKEFAAKPRRGLIGLQNHGTGVEFREVSIKVLK